jgi:hypothetical protein
MGRLDHDISPIGNRVPIDDQVSAMEIIPAKNRCLCSIPARNESSRGFNWGTRSSIVAKDSSGQEKRSS